MDTPPPPASRPRLARAVAHLLGLLAAGVLAWLLWRGWQQPALILDIANVRLC
ncbi:MAG: hypothetical protein IT520_15650 [Burkholderiales bacterium]|nr:hypothetical protein [Burkholderiales bacterium]